jgi:uncharacterized protein (DUF2147 family)
MQKSCLALALACVAVPALAAEPTGDWFVEEKVSVIRIEPCGPAMCGTIGWVKTPEVDKNNPDPSKRNQSIVGVQILRALKPAGQNRWEGEIYNPKDGKMYSGNITLTGQNTLKIQGCVLGFLCGGETWTRAKCDEPAATPAAPPTTAKRPQEKAAPKGTPPAAAASAAFVPLTGCRAAAP